MRVLDAAGKARMAIELFSNARYNLIADKHVNRGRQCDIIHIIWAAKRHKVNDSNDIQGFVIAGLTANLCEMVIPY